MGARSYIAQQNNASIQNAVKSTLGAYESVVKTQIANNGPIIQDQIKADLEREVYGNPDIEKWEDLSTSVFQKGVASVDNGNTTPATKRQLKLQIETMKQAYQSTLSSKKEDASLANLQVELNASAKLIASKPENSLTKSFEDYSNILNKSSALQTLQEHNTDYVTPKEYADTLVPTKATQYVQNSIDNAPNTFMNSVTNEDGSISSTPMTPEGIAQNTISEITNEMSVINPDWKMSDSQKADIKSAAASSYNAKMVEFNTSASNNSNSYLSQIEANTTKGVPTDTKNIKEFYAENYPNFIGSTVGKKIVDYAEAKNDMLYMKSLTEQYPTDISKMTQKDIDGVQLDANRSEVTSSVVLAKALKNPDSLSNLNDFYANCGITLTDAEKATVTDGIIKGLSKDTDQQQITDLLSERFANAPKHNNVIGSLSTPTPIAATISTNNKEAVPFTKEQLIPNNIPSKEQLQGYSLSNPKPEDAVGIRDAVYGNMTYEDALKNKLIPSYVTLEDYSDAVTNVINADTNAHSVGSIKSTIHDAQFNRYVTQTQLDKLITAAVTHGFLSNEDALLYAKKPIWMDFSDYNKTADLIDSVIDQSYSKSTPAERLALKDIASTSLGSWFSKNKPETLKDWEELRINLGNQLSKKQSEKILKNFSSIAKDLSSVSDATDLVKVINNKDYDTFMDESRNGKWDFFINSNDLDDVGQKNHFIQGDPSVSYDRIMEAVTKNIIGDASIDGASDITKAKIQATSTMIYSINRQSQLFKNTFDVKSANVTRIGNEYGYEVDNGIFAMLVNSDTEKTIKGGGLFGGNTTSNWKLVKANKDSSGNYSFENYDKKGNENTFLLSDMDTDSKFSNVNDSYNAISSLDKNTEKAKALMDSKPGSQKEATDYGLAKNKSDAALNDYIDKSSRYTTNSSKLMDAIKFLQTKEDNQDAKQE